jgi:nickel/cobalt exporter
MNDFSVLLQHGASNAWLFVPSAILLGALHGLEPGHSKTMMAAFIIAVRGTLGQAVLLGLAATLSHTAVVWAVALGGLYLGQKWDLEANEGYFQLASAFMIIGIASWMLWRTWHRQREHAHHVEHHRDHQHGDAHVVDTGHGKVQLEIAEDGVPPRFRLTALGGHMHHHAHHHGHNRHHAHTWSARQIAITLERPDGTTERYTFAERGAYAESEQEIPEPHQFKVRLHLGRGDHGRDYDCDLEFAEHGRAHEHAEASDLELVTGEYQDAHELAHANDIRRRFANREATTGQIVLFGLTGGLVPCPASITVLLICLQLKQFTLGVALVLCFSIGLALTMVASGALAALSVRHAAKRWRGFGAFSRKAPLASGVLILLVGCYVGYQGLVALG